MSKTVNEHCYLCGIQIREYHLRPGEAPPPDGKTKDHVPPKALFQPPLPTNLVTVPCCFRCNNKHSGFDERLRILASLPFDRSETGQSVLEKRVLGGTLAKGRQMQFVEKLAASMQPVPGHSDLTLVRADAKEFEEGIIRITKGLLFALHPDFDYRESDFKAIDIQPRASNEQLRLMASLKGAAFFERGFHTFQSWRIIDQATGSGVWMVILYQCFGFFVFHTNGSELANITRLLEGK